MSGWTLNRQERVYVCSTRILQRFIFERAGERTGHNAWVGSTTGEKSQLYVTEGFLSSWGLEINAK
jgi:hypothetical protein